MEKRTAGRGYRGKRLLDVVVAGAALVVLAPLLLALALCVRFALGRPVLFRQTRPGRDHRPFELIKFRTLRDARDADGRPLPDAERMTRFGSWLRSSSLDELPELWCVLLGDMSLVGPRPLLMEYVELYTPEQARRALVRPGITGWAQVHGRNSLDWDDRFRLDVWYVDHASLRLDAEIVLRSVVSVIRRDGIQSDGHATMPKFRGSAR